MFRTLVATLALLCGPAHAGAQLTAASTPDEVMAKIRSEGSSKVMSKLLENEHVFESLLSHVDRAETRWFPVWLKLSEHADGGISESIHMAFARAIPRAPQSVLRLVGSGLTIDRICTSPFIEPEPGVAEEYERTALRALSHVRDPKLKSLAQSCSDRVRLPKERR